MSSRILTSVLLAFLLFAIYSWYTTRLGATAEEGFDINSQQYAPVPQRQVQRVQAEAPRVMAAAGPGAPNQRPPQVAPPTIAPEEVPYDPQEQSHESADIPERLRHPERMFSPGLANEDTNAAVAAGTANYASQMTQNAAQVFGPEFAQNGGNFMDGIMANDSDLNQDYSSV